MTKQYTPLADWASKVSDPWLRKELEERLEVGDLWSELIGIGMLMRFDHENVALKVAEMLAGNYKPRKERVWFRSQPRPNINTLLKRAAEKALLISEEMDELYEEADFENECWRQAVVIQAEQRDELEGIRSLLSVLEDGSAEGFGEALEIIDSECAFVINNLPAFKGHSEHLVRAKSLAQGSWWTEIV